MNLVCLDRDGTINEDDNYYLGSSENWRSQVRLLEGVVEGIRRLNSIPETEIFIVTNQAGVALKNFPELTEKRMNEVNSYIMELLSLEGAEVRNCFACPFVDRKYAEKVRARKWEIIPQYFSDGHRDLKPDIGLLEKCAKDLEIELCRTNLYVIGDRISDVQLGLNGGGKGILVCSPKTIELGDVEKVKAIQVEKPERVFIAKDFYEATNYVA